MAVMLLAVSCNMHASMKEKTEAEVLKMGQTPVMNKAISLLP